MVAADLEGVLALLPSPVRSARTLRGDGGPWLVEYGTERAVLRRTDLGGVAALGFTPELAWGSIAWLHDVLRDLAGRAFVAPAPVSHLGGDSIAVQDGVIWELLTFVAGVPVGWEGHSLYGAGRALASFHDVSLALGPRLQRPGALPLAACGPSHPDAPLEEFRRELAEIGYTSSPRAVIHGDATNSNNVIAHGVIRLVDYAIAYQEAMLADVAFALWRNGRIGADAVEYDPARVAEFVRGYASVRPVDPRESRAIVVYLKGRGMQLQHRAELREKKDASIIQRLLSVRRQQAELEAAVRAALDVRIG